MHDQSPEPIPAAPAQPCASDSFFLTALVIPLKYPWKLPFPHSQHLSLSPGLHPTWTIARASFTFRLPPDLLTPILPPHPHSRSSYTIASGHQALCPQNPSNPWFSMGRSKLLDIQALNGRPFFISHRHTHTLDPRGLI